METMIAVDKQMVGYHGEKAVEPYILTVMNIVSQIIRLLILLNSLLLRQCNLNELSG